MLRSTVMAILFIAILSGCGTIKVHNPNPHAEVYSQQDHGLTAKP